MGSCACSMAHLRIQFRSRRSGALRGLTEVNDAGHESSPAPATPSVNGAGAALHFARGYPRRPQYSIK
ncbi:hypothetical protein ARTHRO8AJ_160086 [Arthrobacter sp. 8AJ]|nr:hypothetical protein ARTHRO8AJ_160086 [Arthrobacter sp. 8AJ]